MGSRAKRPKNQLTESTFLFDENFLSDKLGPMFGRTEQTETDTNPRPARGQPVSEARTSLDMISVPQWQPTTTWDQPTDVQAATSWRSFPFSFAANPDITGSVPRTTSFAGFTGSATPFFPFYDPAQNDPTTTGFRRASYDDQTSRLRTFGYVDTADVFGGSGSTLTSRRMSHPLRSSPQAFFDSSRITVSPLKIKDSSDDEERDFAIPR